MRYDELTDDAVVAELGRRVAAQRIAAGLRQDDFAKRAGVARSTVQRIEGGESVQLSSLVKLLRALDRLQALDTVLEAELPSPLAELQRERSRRKRVRRAPGAESRDAAPGWTWG